MTRLNCWWRVWQAALCSGEAHVAIEPEIPESDLSLESVRMGNTGNGNVLVPVGEEINRDSVIISERKQNKANWILVSNHEKMWFSDCQLNSFLGTWSPLERGTIQCDSHVRITGKELGSIQSTTHRILSGNTGDIYF